MRAVLGIDAAWTEKNPSGVALVAEGPRGWHLVAVASSYAAFQALPIKSSTTTNVFSRSRAAAATMLSTAEALCGSLPSLVAVDMPLSREQIVGRRVSDNAISAHYGSKWASTHTPNLARPGPIGIALRDELEAAGYPLLTSTMTTPGLIEVYPHPALIELTSAPVRLPYKIARAHRYWPTAHPDERRSRILEQWSKIVDSLEIEVAGVKAAMASLGLENSGAALKAYEDALDAVVCAWVGIRVLEGRAMPFGDDTSSIWVPAR